MGTDDALLADPSPRGSEEGVSLDQRLARVARHLEQARDELSAARGQLAAEPVDVDGL